jgi:hypothetical protein
MLGHATPLAGLKSLIQGSLVAPYAARRPWNIQKAATNEEKTSSKVCIKIGVE